MNKYIAKNYLLVIITLVSLFSGCSHRLYPVSEKDMVRKDVYYLASRELEGRQSGGKGDSLAAEFIRNRFQKMGLQLMGNNGFQPFSLVTSVELGDSNRLAIQGKYFELNHDYLPYSFSSGSSFTGKVAFAGYGFDIQSDTLKWNDYSNLDVSDKWVMILKGDPEIDKSESVFEPYSEERAKVLTATDHKAAGILFVGGPAFNESDQLQGLFYDKNSGIYPVPVFQITRKVADMLIAGSNVSFSLSDSLTGERIVKTISGTDLNIAQLEKKINTARKPLSFISNTTVSGRAHVIPRQVKSNNIIALLPGEDQRLKSQYVIIGAHYDHLGFGGPGSGSRALDTVAVHYGADDNASGVAAVLDLAQRFAKERNTRRSIVFAAFGAEEMGLIGSKTFTDQSPVDLKKTVAMFNFDMVGRLDSSRALSIGGTQTSLEAEKMLTDQNQGFNLAFSGEGTGPSDHSSFYLQNIPVFFFSTGAHPDYHTPGDTPEKINYEGIGKINDYTWKIISEIANRDSTLTFQEAGSKMKRSRGGRFKVTLGVMPDYAGLEKKGMRIDAVTKGKPAEKAGLQKGDIITAIDGKTVGNIYDYMNRLKTLSEGQTISVDIVRNGQHMVLLVQL
jgi:aminopeptidase YwaD